MQELMMLVVDDEEDVCERLRSILSRKFNCTVEMACNGQGALEKIKHRKFDLVILDIKMPGLSGIDVLKEGVKVSPETKFLAMSGYDSHEVANEALRAGAVDFISKPQTPESIELKVRQILGPADEYPQR